MAKTREDLVGRIFGYWTILENAEDRIFGTQRKQVVVAKCRCGTIKSVLVQNILNKKSQSCGCLQKERASAWMNDNWENKRPVMSDQELEEFKLKQLRRKQLQLKKRNYAYRRILEIRLEKALKELAELEQRNEKRIAKKQSE